MGKHEAPTSNMKMKVTVCFGTVRVIVPIPNSEEMLVRDLIHQATLRYKKASGKGQGSWVVVHKLKSQSDGGILDPDDRLVDVADDREQIMAIYDEENDGIPSLQHNVGDGTSASSVGTSSPDIFQGNDHKFQPFARTDIEVTDLGSSFSGPSSGSPSGGSSALQVRRGSEPALNTLSPAHHQQLSPPDASKRWSAAAAPIIDGIIDEEELSKKDDMSEPSSSSTAQITSSSQDSNKSIGKTVSDDESSISRTNNSGSRPIITNTSVISNSNSMAVHSNYNNNPIVVNNHGGINNSFAVSSHQDILSSSAKSTQYQQHHQQQTNQYSGNGSNFVQLTEESNSDGIIFDVNSYPASASTGSTAVFISNNSGSNNTNSNINQLHTSNGSKIGNSHVVGSLSQQVSESAHGSRFSRDQNRLSIQQTEAKWADAADRALWLSFPRNKTTGLEEPLGPNSPETPTDSISSPNAFSTPVMYNNNNNNNSASIDNVPTSFPVYHRNYSSPVSHNGRIESKESHATYDMPNHNGFEDVQRQMFQHGDVNNKFGMQGEEVVLVLRYEAGPLGIHVVPEHFANAKNQGLIVQGVEAGGRIDRDGRLQSGDKIIEINGNSLIGVPFQKAQELFREGLNTAELHLKVIKMFNRDRKKNCLRDQDLNSHTEVDESPHAISVQHLVQKFNGSENVTEEKENMVHSHEKIVGDAKIATVSPTKGLIEKGFHPNETTKKLPLQAVPLTRPSTTTTLINSNTRKIGRKYEIDLQKGPQGLGFSITTRDNPAGGNCPIYIKNILPTGAAIDDGRLRPGDRLLDVNGIEITGKSQAEAVSILRNVPQGGIAKLIVSRQERVDLSPKLPRQIPPEKVMDDVQPVPWSEREILAYDIPVLDTEKAGLGISVKGKTTAAQRGNMVDMGIYIKSVIHGGAASRDTRLKPNDQLLSINGVSLLERSNTDAMETLRKTMTQDGPKPKPGYITLTIARRVPSSSAPTTDISGCGSSASGDEMDSWGTNSISVDGNRSSAYAKHSHMNQIENPDSNNTAILLSSYNQSQQNQSQYPPQNYSIQQQQQQEHLRSSFRTPQNIGNEQKMKDSSLSPAFPIGKMPVDLSRNPVLDRLTGKSNNPAVRNESYYRATNETWNATIQSKMMSGDHRGPPSDAVNSIRQPVTVQNLRGETLLIEDDYSAPQKPPRRSRSSTPDDALIDISSSPTRKPPTSEVTSQGREQSSGEPLAGPFSDATYASQTSLEDSGGFFRDAFGRQSMSEKRHATRDAKNTDTYQRNKKLREERERQKQGQGTDQEIYSNKHGEALARERNLQDEMARRGTKRPFSSSTEDDLIQSGGGELTSFEGGGACLNRLRSSNYATEHPRYTGIEARPISPCSSKTRKSFGDQLLELFHHWGQRNQTTHRSGEGLQRVNSADSLVDSVKQPQSSLSGSNVKAVMGTYQRKGEQVPLGPSLGMKKSSSLESLQTMVQEIQIQEDVKSGYGPVRAGPATVRVVRGRGCNESFRQAVDRSYETVRDGEPWVSPHSHPDQRKKIHQKRLQETLGGENNMPNRGDLDSTNPMETLAEEETDSTYGQRPPYSEPSESDFDGIYGKSKGVKKKQGLFRGLGSMFRFGRHRKSTGSGGMSAEMRRQQTAELEQQQREGSAEEMKREKARQAAHSEQMRIQEQYRRLVEKQNQESQSAETNNNPTYGITVSIASTNAAASSNYNHGPNYGNLRGNTNSSHTGSNLHPHHQFRKSMENQAIRDRERERDRDVNGNHFQNPNHLRSASYDVYNEMTRPGSRVGFVDPKKYSHYNLNYEEIRHHLKDDKPNGKLSEDQLSQMRITVIEQRKKAILESRRHQQHYHSQRRENPRSRQERPVSNFYEYESVQTGMHTTQQGPPSTNSHYSQHNHGLHNNGLPQQQQQQYKSQFQGGVNNNNQQQQSLYVINGYGNMHHNNNGVTLPSPTTLPISFQHHQRSPSQFQAQTISGHSRLHYGGRDGSSSTLQHQQSQKFPQQQPKPNSLPRDPRRSQKDLIGQQHRHPIHQQQVLENYNNNTQSQNSVVSLQGFRVVLPQNSRIPSSQHNHNHPNGLLHRNLPNNTSLGSKV